MELLLYGSPKFDLNQNTKILSSAIRNMKGLMVLFYSFTSKLLLILNPSIVYLFIADS